MKPFIQSLSTEVSRLTTSCFPVVFPCFALDFPIRLDSEFCSCCCFFFNNIFCFLFAKFLLHGCWYVICVADCGICNVITAIYVPMCMFVVKCICVWEWAQTKVALRFYFWRHGFWSLTVPEAHGLTNEPMIRDPPYLCSPQCLPPTAATLGMHTQLLHAVGRQVSELRTSCLYSKCLNN